MNNDEPMFQCTVCGQTGTVGRCCGLETRMPLNGAALCRQIHDAEFNAENDRETVRRELDKRHRENERLTRCAKKIGQLILQRNRARELARELADALVDLDNRGSTCLQQLADALVAVLEAK